jgi:predicted TIM-barrel fold metal-dependent hydrolase
MTMVEKGLVDCDVHTSVPSASVLYPYLSDFWAEYLDFSNFEGFIKGLPNYTYPRWSTMLRTTPTELTLETVQEQALAEVDYSILHCHYGVESYTHPYFAPELARAVNEWMRDEWLEKDLRLLGSITVAPQFADTAASEIARAAQDPRFVEVVLPARSGDGYGHHRYWPILEAAAEHDLVVAIHYGGAVAGSPPTPCNWMGTFFEDYVSHPFSFQTHVNSMIMGGVFERWPNLKVVLVESGWTWLPGWMWRMDWEWKQMGREVPWVRTPPSTYVRKHFRFTLQPTDVPAGGVELVRVLEQIAAGEVDPAELLLYSSDYPHRYLRGPDELLEGLTTTQHESVRSKNAIAWYGIRERLERPLAVSG